MLKTYVSESTYHWVLSGLLRNGALTRLSYDSYSLSLGLIRDVYMRVYSSIAEG